MVRCPARFTLFPYTTLFRSSVDNLSVAFRSGETTFNAVRDMSFTVERGETLAIDRERQIAQDRKSTRLKSSHANISYAVFCLKKEKDKCHSNRDYRDCSDHS